MTAARSTGHNGHPHSAAAPVTHPHAEHHDTPPYGSRGPFLAPSLSPYLGRSQHLPSQSETFIQRHSRFIENQRGRPIVSADPFSVRDLRGCGNRFRSGFAAGLDSNPCFDRDHAFARGPQSLHAAELQECGRDQNTQVDRHPTVAAGWRPALPALARIVNASASAKIAAVDHVKLADHQSMRSNTSIPGRRMVHLLARGPITRPLNI